MAQAFHIVTRFDGVGGTESHACELRKLLSDAGHSVTLWSEHPSARAVAVGARQIDSFARRFPIGGTMILLGTHQEPGLWLDQARPTRAILICNLFSINRTFAFLTQLERPTLPRIELVFVSTLLREAAALPGFICPPLIDLGRFHPSHHLASERFRIGRHSRDDPLKHHPDDPSLYRLAAWSGIAVSLMGAESIRNILGTHPLISVHAVGAQDASLFLGGLDSFVFRTHPNAPEASGRAVMEAMASGLPVIASANGGYAEWLTDGKEGFFADTQEEMFDRIMTLSTDAGLRKKCATNARAAAERICGGTARSRYLSWLTGD